MLEVLDVTEAANGREHVLLQSLRAGPGHAACMATHWPKAMTAERSDPSRWRGPSEGMIRDDLVPVRHNA